VTLSVAANISDIATSCSNAIASLGVGLIVNKRPKSLAELVGVVQLSVFHFMRKFRA